jgi:tetratricopeptide (TPR) repeat protein
MGFSANMTFGRLSFVSLIIAALQLLIVLPAVASEDFVAVGYQLLGSGRPAEAVSEFQKALDRNRDDLEANEGIAWAYYKLGEFALAARYADNRLALAPKDNEWRKSQLTILFEVPARRGEALSGARDLVREHPDDLDARLLLGRLTAWSGKARDAQPILEDVLRQAPNNFDALVTLAEIAQTEHDQEQALRLLQRAVTLKPGDTKLQAKLAAAAEQLRRYRLARLQPTLPLVLGVIGLSILVGQISPRLTATTYWLVFGYVSFITGAALAWLYLVPLN